MESEVINSLRICPVPPGSKMGLNWRLKPRTIMAVSLTFILTTSGLVYYLTTPIGGIMPDPWIEPKVYTPHGAIAIDGDANFTATALVEGWSGDGSPENPFVIDGLEIDRGDEFGHCISIINTRVSFIISNCNLTGAERFGIFLENVTNCDLVENTCNNNGAGIVLFCSESITVAKNNCSNNGAGIVLHGGNYDVVNNTCIRNIEHGIELFHTSSSIIANNTCNSNGVNGIYLDASVYNTVTNNTCNNNTEYGIWVSTSNPSPSNGNTISANTCNYNRIGIYSDDLSNIVADNTCLGNTEHDIFGEYITEKAGTVEDGTEEFNPIGFLFVGFPVIMILGAVWIIILGAAWRMLAGIRKYDQKRIGG